MNKNNNHFLKHSKSSIKSDDDLIYYDILATNYTKETSNIRLNLKRLEHHHFFRSLAISIYQLSDLVLTLTIYLSLYQLLIMNHQTQTKLYSLCQLNTIKNYIQKI